MIVSVTGCIEHLDKSHLVLKAGSLSYEMAITTHLYNRLMKCGDEEVSVLVRLVVREDSMSLFGFVSIAERTLFDKLCQVSGVGPKLALSILSAYTPTELFHIADSQQDSKLLKISGVGKKMAIRLIVELDAIFDKFPELAELDVCADLNSTHTDIQTDVIEALVGMGFERSEVVGVFDGASYDILVDPHAALRYALRQMGGVSHVGSKY